MARAGILWSGEHPQPAAQLAVGIRAGVVVVDIPTLIITPVVAALVGFGVWFIQSRIESLRRAQERLHDERRKVYAEVLEPFIRMFAGIKDPAQQQQAVKHLVSFDYRRTAFEFTLLGADEVIDAYNQLMAYAYTMDAPGAKPDAKVMIRLWGEFLLALRRNVGNPDTRLDAVDMLRSQVKDIDDVLE